MKPSHAFLLAICASLALPSTVLADEFIGGILDRSGGNLDALLTAGIGAIEAPHRPDPSDALDHERLPWYGQGHVRLELGLGIPKTSVGNLGIGVNGGVTLGYELIDVAHPGRLGLSFGSTRAALHAGIEGSTHFNANTDDERREYVELMPMASLGLQATHGTCHALAAVRAGGALGTLGENGRRPAYGTEMGVVCKGMKAAGEWTHIDSDKEPAKIGSFDFKKVKIGRYRNSYWGVRGEMINTRSIRALPEVPGTHDRNEYRVLVTAGSAAL